MQVVLMGQLGSGKTTLYNRITNSQEKVQSGGNSVTMQVFLKASSYGSGFKVLDTPGFGASQDKLKHAAGIIAALSEGPVNRLLVIVKHDRTDTMKKAILPVIAPLARFRPLITIVVTHWDLATDQAGDKAGLEAIFRRININSYIYTSKNESPNETCTKIDKELESSPAQLIQLIETEYTSQFDLAQFEVELELEVEIMGAELKQEFRKKAAIIKDFISKYDKDAKDLPEVMHVLTLEAKKLAEQTLKQFEDKNFEICNQMVAQSGADQIFLMHVLLKKEMESDIDDVMRCAQKKMLDHKGHCFNFIKMCNFCGEIWLKVEGCTGQTVCGAVPRVDELLQNTQAAPQKWNVNWKGSTFELEFNANYQPKLESQLKYQKFQFNQIKTIDNQGNVVDTNKEGTFGWTVGQLGCKRKIVWSEMAPLDQGKLSELISPELLDYFCTKDKELSKHLQQTQMPVQDKLKQLIKDQTAKIKRN